MAELKKLSLALAQREDNRQLGFVWTSPGVGFQIRNLGDVSCECWRVLAVLPDELRAFLDPLLLVKEGGFLDPIAEANLLKLVELGRTLRD